MLKIPTTQSSVSNSIQLPISTAVAKLNLPLGQLLKVDVLHVQPLVQSGLKQVTLSMQGQTLTAQTDLNLRIGQQLLVQGQRSENGQILLKIQPTSLPIQADALRQALPNQVNLTQALAQLVQIQPQLPPPVNQPLQQLLASLRLSNLSFSNQQLAQAIQQGSTNLEAQLASGQGNPNNNIKAALLRLSQGLQQWQASAASQKQSLIGQLLRQVNGAINQVTVQQIQWLELDYQWISQHLLNLNHQEYLARLFFKNLSTENPSSHWQIILELNPSDEAGLKTPHYLQLDWYTPSKLTLGLFTEENGWQTQFFDQSEALKAALEAQGFQLARLYPLTVAPDPLKLTQDFQLIDIRI
jgi:hypothetical protein